MTEPIPPPGTAAYWSALRRAHTLVAAWDALVPDEDPWQEMAALSAIVEQPLALRVMHAQGHAPERWLESLRAMCQDGEDDSVDDQPDPDEPPSGEDWCPRGCQLLCRLGQCGLCGYEGRGVALTCTATVAEYCLHCRARTYQSRDGICELCGRDAEDVDAPATTAPAVLLSMEER